MTTAGEIIFAFCLVLSWFSSCLHIIGRDAMLYTRGPFGRAELRWTKSASWLLLASLPYLAAVVAFTLRWFPEWVGIAIIAALGLQRQIERRLWAGDYVVGLGKYVPAAACLMGWLFAYHLTRGATTEWRRAAGWEAACGVIGVTYTVAGIAKIKDSGRRWFRGSTLGLLVAERALDGPAWVRRLRMGVVKRPRASTFLNAYGLFAELFGVLVVLPLLRWPMVGILTLLQIGVVLFLGYVELEWTLVLIAVALASNPGLA